MAGFTDKVKVAIEVTADAAQAETRVKAIQRQIKELSSSQQKIVLDANISELQSKLKKAKAEISSLSDEDLKLQVEVIGEGEQQLRELKEMADKVNGEKVVLDVDTDAATGHLSRARGGLDDVTKSAGSSKSVLANMIGNSVQDLGALGGVAGSAGVAVGQMGEYMADAAASGDKFGSIARNFALVSGPIAALAIGVPVLAMAWEDLTDHQNEAQKSAVKLKDAQDALAKGDAAAAATKLAENYGDLLTKADQAGVSVQEFIGFVSGASSTLGENSDEIQRNAGFLGSLGGELNNARAGWKLNADEMARTAQQTTALEGVVSSSTGIFGNFRAAVIDAANAAAAETKAAEETAGAIDALNQMRDAAIEVLGRQQTAALSLIDSEVGYKRAVDDVGLALLEFQAKQGLATTTVDDAKTSTDEAAAAQQAMEGSSRSLEDAISKTAAQAVIYGQDQAEAAGQTFGTEQAIAAQVGALQELKAKYPELAAPIDAHIAKLNAIPTTKNTDVTVDTSGALADLSAFDIALRNIPRTKDVTINVINRGQLGVAAEGGPVAGLTLVGEKGPELVAFPPSGAFVFTAEETRRLKAGGMAGGGSTGGDGIVVDGVFYSTPPPAPTPNSSLPFGYFADAAGLHQPTGGPNFSGASTSLIPSTMPWGWWDAPGAFAGLSPNTPSRPPVGVGSNRTASGTTINIYTGANPQEVIEAIRRYERMNGTSWRN